MGQKIIAVPGKGNIAFPDTMSNDEIASVIKSQSISHLTIQQPKTYTGTEAAIEGAKNLIPSTAKYAEETVSALTHPIDTIQNVLNLGAGELSKVLPKSVNDYLNKADEAVMGKQKAEQLHARQEKVADVVNKQYADRYGSAEGFKRAVAEDPASVLGDVSTVLTGGASVAGKASKLGSMLEKASQVTNPLFAAEKLVTTPISVASTLGKGTVGLSTGAGKEAITQAVKSGETGNVTFLNNLRKTSNMEDAVDIAKTGLDNMRKEKNAAYRSGMYDISQDKSVLNFDDIDAAIKNAKEKNYDFGEYKDTGAQEALNKVQKLVNTWKKKSPDAHTPEGMDFLKQKINNEILSKLDYKNDAFARNLVGDVYSNLKATINKQAPQYAEVMKNYGEAADQIDEIKRALSLNEKASADTSLKKLQSILRDDVSSSFGHRKDLAQNLIEHGSEDLMPALAGQALSSWKPRGLAGQLETYGGLGYALTHPAALGTALMAAPFAMPRVVGEAAYAYGKGKGALKRTGQKIPFTKEQARKAAMLLQQTQPNQEEQ